MAEPLFIEEIISRITEGRVRIPSFQRGFIWDADRVAHLMDSIYKGYPFGNLLFWRTSIPLHTERDLGPFKLNDNEPGYPVDYILDGQQRATSIFGVFQNRLMPQPGEDDSWTRIYFDLSRPESAQESQFLYVSDAEFDATIHFPLRIIFNPPKYRQFLKKMNDEIADQVDQLYKRFTTARIPVQTFETDDRAAVAIVFERINRLGVELDTLQLLSAWSWSEDFDLQHQFGELSDELHPYGFKDVGADSDLLLRCCAAIIANDASPNTIINLKGAEVRKRFKEVKSGILGAIDFLRTNLNVYSTDTLPYTNIIVPLSVFFATQSDQNTHPDAEQQRALSQWIWRTFFTRRYSKRLEQLNQDIGEVAKLRARQPSNLGEFPVNIDPSFFLENTFSLRNVDSKTFILMLASESPLDFISGGQIAIGDVLRGCNKKEFHHVFPRAYLKANNERPELIDSLANICILPRASNNKISDDQPSVYRRLMPSDSHLVTKIIRSAFCPDNVFEDHFKPFVHDRADVMVRKAKSLMGV